MNHLLCVGSLEEHLNKLHLIDKDVNAYKPNIEELEKINQDIQKAMIFENRHTPYTMETLRVGWEQLMTSVARSINELENQVNYPYLAVTCGGSDLKTHK